MHSYTHSPHYTRTHYILSVSIEPPTHLSKFQETRGVPSSSTGASSGEFFQSLLSFPLASLDTRGTRTCSVATALPPTTNRESTAKLSCGSVAPSRGGEGGKGSVLVLASCARAPLHTVWTFFLWAHCKAKAALLQCGANLALLSRVASRPTTLCSGQTQLTQPLLCAQPGSPLKW